MKLKRLKNMEESNHSIQTTRRRKTEDWKEQRTYDRDIRARPYPRIRIHTDRIRDENDLEQIIDEIIEETLPINKPINPNLPEETIHTNNPVNQTSSEEDISTEDFMEQTAFETFDNTTTQSEETEEFRSDIEDLEANLFLSSTPTDNPRDQDILMTAEEERVYHLEELLKIIRRADNHLYELEHEIIITQLLRRARAQMTNIHDI